MSSINNCDVAVGLVVRVLRLSFQQCLLLPEINFTDDFALLRRTVWPAKSTPEAEGKH